MGQAGWRWALVSGLESIKKKSACQLSGQKGASRRLSRTKIAFTCIPRGNAQNTGFSQPGSTHTHTWTHSLIWAETYTFFLSFMPDYNGIILIQPMHSQTYTSTRKPQMVQKGTIISAYISFVPVPAWICVCRWKEEERDSLKKSLKTAFVDLPGGGKMMSKRQICIY